LPVEVPSHEALAKEFDAVHLCLCAASAVISGQFSPECSSKILARPHSFVSRDGTRRGWLPKLRILARWYDDVNGGVKTCHWGGAKAGQFGVRALERVALK